MIHTHYWSDRSFLFRMVSDDNPKPCHTCHVHSCIDSKQSRKFNCAWFAFRNLSGWSMQFLFLWFEFWRVYKYLTKLQFSLFYSPPSHHHPTHKMLDLLCRRNLIVSGTSLAFIAFLYVLISFSSVNIQILPNLTCLSIVNHININTISSILCFSFLWI